MLLRAEKLGEWYAFRPDGVRLWQTALAGSNQESLPREAAEYAVRV